MTGDIHEVSAGWRVIELQEDRAGCPLYEVQRFRASCWETIEHPYDCLADAQERARRLAARPVVERVDWPSVRFPAPAGGRFDNLPRPRPVRVTLGGLASRIREARRAVRLTT